MAGKHRGGVEDAHDPGPSLAGPGPRCTFHPIVVAGPATLPTVTGRRRSVYLRGMNTLAANETTAPTASAPPPVQTTKRTAKPAAGTAGKIRPAATAHTTGMERARPHPRAARLLAGLFGGRRHPDLLAKAAAPAMLASAWSRVRRNAGVAGGDGLSCRAFERDARSRLARLRRDLLSGRYAPGPVRRVEIVKESGGTPSPASPTASPRLRSPSP